MVHGVGVFRVFVPLAGSLLGGKLEDDQTALVLVAFQGGYGVAAGQKAAAIFSHGGRGAVCVFAVDFWFGDDHLADDVGDHGYFEESHKKTAW